MPHDTVDDTVLAGIVARTGDRVRWSVSIDIDGQVVAELGAHDVLPTASMGKVLLLAEVARRIEDGSLDARIAIAPEDSVGDSGLLQWMAEPELWVESLAVLVAATSDNLATNVLLRTVGLDAVDRLRADAGLESTRLLDRIRDERGAGDPPWPSQGCAAELRQLLAAIDTGSFVSPAVSARLRGWLRLNTDLSMVAAPWCLDPLAHDAQMSKTGTDLGVRADAGVLRVGDRVATYAVLASWDPSTDLTVPVMAAMRDFGRVIGSAIGLRTA